jgi:hypothetical protein
MLQLQKRLKGTVVPPEQLKIEAEASKFPMTCLVPLPKSCRVSSVPDDSAFLLRTWIPNGNHTIDPG